MVNQIVYLITFIALVVFNVKRQNIIKASQNRTHTHKKYK